LNADSGQPLTEDLLHCRRAPSSGNASLTGVVVGMETVRRLAFVITAAAAILGLASCVHGGRSSAEPCAGTPNSRTETSTARPTTLLGVRGIPNTTAVMLARLDPLSLRPVSSVVRLGEYHEAWSLSPDGSRVALGISAGESLISPSRRLRGRIGIVIVDLNAMKVVQEVETGIAASGLGWLAPRLLVASLLRGGAVLVDPVTGKILRRWPGLSDPGRWARTGDSLVMLFPGPSSTPTDGTAATRLALVDARGHMRSVVLERIQLAAGFANGVGYADEAALAVDAGGRRTYVFVAGAPAAEINLATMQVSYHRVELETGAQPKKTVLARVRRALWLGGHQVAVFGRNFVAEDRAGITSIAAGAALVDTASWNSCVVDANAGGATFAAGRLLAYASGARPAIGLRAYTARGVKIFHLFNSEQVLDVHVAGGRAYVQTASALRVVDLKSRRVLKTIVPPFELVDVIDKS
jgi:hypothetical protein